MTGPPDATDATVVPVPEPKESIVDVNARSSNDNLENGGIRVDDPSSFQYRVLSGAVGNAAGAWLKVNDIPSKTGRRIRGSIFTLSEGSGSPEQCKRAQKYARLALASERGWTKIDPVADDDQDLSIMAVPEAARDSVLGRSGATFLDLSKQKSVCIFAINDGNAAPPVHIAQAPLPWLAVGQKVEVLKKGDVRCTRWVPATVARVESQSKVCVQLDSLGIEQLVDWYGNLRPHLEASAMVESYLETPPAEILGEGVDGTSEWTPTIFISWAASGGANVRRLDGTEVEVEAGNVRLPGLNEEAPTNREEETPRAPIRLAIFGEQRGRVESVLSIMSTVELLTPGFFASNPPPLPPALEGVLARQEEKEEAWFSTSVELAGGADATRRHLDQIQKACDWRVVAEVCGSIAHVVGPPTACRLAEALVRLAAVAERSEIAAEHAPQDLLASCDLYVEKIPVPGDLVPFVAGKQRGRLKEIEAVENVIIFFWRHPLPKEVPAEGTEGAAADGSAAKVDIMILGIDARSRTRARLPLIRTVEAKAPGHVLDTDPQPYTCLEDVVATDILEFAEDSMGWLSGKQGANRRRIAAASGCVLEYFTHYAYLAGTGAERARARQYLAWLLVQRPDARGAGEREIPLPASEVDGRDDVTVVMLTPDEKTSIVKELGNFEDETKTFMVFRRKPDVDFFAAGEKITFTRGGRSFFIEIQEAPTGEDMSFRCKLLLEDPWIDEEEASKVPLMIFGADAYQRAAGEQKIREYLARQEAWEPAWGEEAPADSKDSWDTYSAGNYDKKDEKSWDAPSAAAWERADDKKKLWGKKEEDKPQEWNGETSGSHGGASGWGAWGVADEKKAWEENGANTLDTSARVQDSWSAWPTGR